MSDFHGSSIDDVDLGLRRHRDQIVIAHEEGVILVICLYKVSRLCILSCPPIGV